MSGWQLIETAPRDGTPVIVTDGKTFAVATPWDYVEPDTLGHGETERPNPDAGKVHKFWTCYGLTAWTNAVYADWDHNVTADFGEHYRLFDRATHWMPLFEPPGRLDIVGHPV